MKYTSSELVIAKIIRDLGTQYNLPFDDIYEWIGEILQVIKSKKVLTLGSASLQICNYRAILPPSLEKLMAVTYRECRLPYGLDQRNLRRNPRRLDDLKDIVKEEYLDSLWHPEVEVHKIYNEEGELVQSLYGASRDFHKLRKVQTTDLIHPEEYYTLNGNYINTSFEEGEIIIDYLENYCDGEGKPMIPDNYALREAIYYYVVMKLLGRGMRHPALGYADALQIYDRYIARAKAEIKFPSLDEMESTVKSIVNLMPDRHKYEAFNENSER